MTRMLVWSDGRLTGGAGRQSELVADALADRGHEVVLAHPGDPGAVPECGPDPTRVVYGDHDLWDPTIAAGPGPELIRSLIARLAPDVVLVNDTCPAANLGLKRALIAEGAPWVAVEHETLVPPSHRTVDAVAAARDALSAAAAVITVSGTTRDELCARFGLARQSVTVVANGRPDGCFRSRDPERRARARSALGFGPADFVAVIVARVENDKGSLLVLQAVEQLAGSDVWDRLRLRWAGTGTQLRRMRGLAAVRRWSPQLELLGFRDDVDHLLDAADVLVHPTYHEGMPLAVIEAMAAGVPVVGTAVPSMVETVGETGVLVADPHDDPGRTASELADALARLAVQGDEVERLGAAAAARAVALYRLSTMVDRYEEVLSRAAS